MSAMGQNDMGETTLDMIASVTNSSCLFSILNVNHGVVSPTLMLTLQYLSFLVTFWWIESVAITVTYQMTIFHPDFNHP